MGTEPLGRYLGELITQPRFRAGRPYAAFQVWPQVVGRELARRASPVWVRGGVLHVLARDNAWANQIVLMKAQILDRLHRELGDDTIVDLRVFAGELSTRTHPRRKSQSRPRFPAPGSPPDFSAIVDVELRSAVERLWHHAKEASR